MKNVLNLDELKLEDFSKGEKFASRCARIGPLVTLRYGLETRRIRAGDIPVGGVDCWKGEL